MKGYYYIGVYKPNLLGWRQERVDAEFVRVSPKMVRVVAAHLDPAESKRQWFNAAGVERREIGKIKRLASIKLV